MAEVPIREADVASSSSAVELIGERFRLTVSSVEEEEEEKIDGRSDGKVA